MQQFGEVAKFLYPLPLFITQLILGVFVYFNKRNSEINISFSLYAISIALWNYSVFMVFDRTLPGVTPWDIWLMVWAACIPAFFLYFSLVFPEKISHSIKL